jgi:hypothetical protein
MRAYLRLVIGAAVLAAPAVAGAAEVGWKLAKKDGRPYLFAMLAEPEADTLFWVRCAAGGRSMSALAAMPMSARARASR